MRLIVNRGSLPITKDIGIFGVERRKQDVKISPIFERRKSMRLVPQPEIKVGSYD